MQIPFLAVDSSTKNDFNVLLAQHLEGDEAELFFCGEYINVVPPDTDFYDILVACGIFPSKGQARKNGFKAEIADGITDVTVGKKRIRIYILKPTEQNYLTAEEKAV